MAKAGYTKGRWTAMVDSPRKDGMKRSSMVATSGGRMAIDCTESGNTFNQDRANAHLIAAAPDLYEAANAVKDSCPCDPDINPKWEAAWFALKQAIAKAEGR
jgi:hypothetical protein